MKLRRLLAGAVILPDHPSWNAQTLGPGSVVGVMKENKASPVTSRSNEIYVTWVDVAGRENTGWLAAHTPMDVKGTVLKRECFHADDALTAWDQLRYKMGWPMKVDRKTPMALTWLANKGVQHRAELLAVIRELGGRPSKQDDDDTLVRRALRLILSREVRMSEIHEAQTTTKKSAKKGGAKAATKTKAKTTRAAKKIAFKPKETAANSGNLAISTGERIMPLLKKAGITDGLKECKLLSAGKSVSAAALLALRDAVNEAAGVEMEKKHPKAAAELRRANRMVRRLARRAAKAKH